MLTEEQRRIFAFQSIGDEAMQPTAEMLEEQAKKEARLKAEKEWMAEQAAENRERIAQEKQKASERDFKQRCEAMFFEVNPNAESKDFLRLYDKIRDRVLMDTTVEALLRKTEYSLVDEMR